MLPTPARAQTAEPAQQVLTLTLDEAVGLALTENYALRKARLNVDNAEAQIREAWGQVMPQVSASAGYTRNLVTANPFAGSDITGLFGGGNATDWVAYNERARTDDDPATEPITFPAFQDSLRAAQQAAGLTAGGFGGNPFGVDNVFQSGITIEQTLFNGSAFAAIAGAQQLEDVNRLAVDRQQELLVDQVRQTFYQALLAQERARVAAQSVQRTQATLQEVSRQVERGTVPKFQRLSAEVELANLETQFVEARNQAGQALDNLKLTLALPIAQPIRLRGTLEVDDPARFQTVSFRQAATLALQHRPDLKQARLAVELREIDKNITQAQRLPTVSAFVNLNYIGRVPDDRTAVITDPDDPFFYDTATRGFFADELWNPSVSAGVQLSWNIFSGFQTAAQVEQREVAVSQAQIDYRQLQQQVRLEVQQALRNLEAARRRIQSQQRNVERAQTNYQFVDARLREGVSTQLELREASDQLDRTRLNYLQAVYDYLTARSAFRTAIGMPMAPEAAINLTRR